MTEYAQIPMYGWMKPMWLVLLSIITDLSCYLFTTAILNHILLSLYCYCCTPNYLYLFKFLAFDF